MIRKNFVFSDPDFNYSVLINKIMIKQNELSLDVLFKIMEDLQKIYENSIIQFFNDFNVLNEKHIFNSIYFTRKAFNKNIPISNKQSIEFILYLSAKRQIKIAIESFGLKKEDLKKGILNYCIVSNNDDLNQINQELLENFYFEELKFDYEKKTIEKYNRIKSFYDLADEQINTILNSISNKKTNDNLEKDNINRLYEVLNDLICEKMALLSLEGVKFE